MYRLFYDFLLQERMNVVDLVTHRYRATDAKEA